MMPWPRFANREQAGRTLAAHLAAYRARPDVLVLALPRGGLPVGEAVAEALEAPLDVFLVRKLGVPGHEELAMGAIAHGGARVLNAEVVATLGLSQEDVERAARREAREIERREREYRGTRPFPDVRGRTVILVDDGLATGATMRVAVVALRQLGPARIVVAAPVGAPESCREVATIADETVCTITPEPFHAVGQFYDDFRQTTDLEVQQSLARATERASRSAPAR
jgi:predicted phosphoribosyltransferase